MERCPNCGASIRTGARFCTACGFRLLEAPGAASAAPPADDAPVTNPDSSTDNGSSASSDAQRVVWHDDPRPEPELATSSAPSQSASSSGSDESPIPTPRLASVDEDTVPEPRGTDQATGMESLDAEATSLRTEPAENSDETISDDGASSSANERNEASLDLSYEQEETSSRVGTTAEPIMLNEDRADIVQSDPSALHDSSASSSVHPDAEPVSAEVPSNLDGDETGEFTDDAPETSPSELASTIGHADADAHTDADSIDTEPTNISVASPDEAPASAEPDETFVSGSDQPGVEPLTWQDDVVIETSFMAETDQPGSYNEDPDILPESNNVESLPGFSDARLEEGTRADQIDDSELTQPGDVGSDATSREEETGTSRGRDEEYEPWGDAGLGDATSSANQGGEANGLPISQTELVAADQQQGSGGTTGIAQARMLLEQLRSTIDSLEEAPEPITDRTTESASSSVAEIGLILEGFPAPAVDADRLAVVTRLAEDLSGRDYDIRALQTFAQERDTILSLTMEVQQLRDVIDQIRSVLGNPDS